MALKRQDWNLLALATAKGEPLTPVQFQKVLFLLGHEKPKAVGGDYYRFTPYNYGPFDQQVYLDAEALEQAGLVSIRRPSRWAEYSATPAGLAQAKRIAAAAPQDAVQYLQNVVTWARGLTFQALVRAIYQKYPRYRANSVFQG